MWRRIYLLLLVVRLYFALSSSYLHPDENFQGPEVIAGQVFSYPVHNTWEFTSTHPIRSTFPLWLVYGLPMLILRSLWGGLQKEELPPAVVYWTLRVLMFILSFVLEDWALQELVQSPRSRRVAILLVASSYVTWTYQTHTFSNAIETLVVLWSLVLIGRIRDEKIHSGALVSLFLAFLLVLGVFNRITFLAYVALPALQLIPQFKRKPLAPISLVISGAAFAFLAVFLDTAFYTSEPVTFMSVLRQPIITPLNNLFYNISTANLAEHGLHPFYQHVVANLPLLLGPAFPLLLFYHQRNWRLYSALCAVAVLSLVPHQEARFLIPAVPLILSSLKLPGKFTKAWIWTWIAFNLVMGILMGAYHQGGVVPMQIHLAKQQDVKEAFWWKTYSPPIWLLDGKSEMVNTIDFMGMQPEEMVRNILDSVSCAKKDKDKTPVVLVAPWSATYLDRFTSPDSEEKLILEELWRYQRHLNLDDVDFEADGIWSTLNRIIGRRGLVLWKVKKRCT